MKIKKEDRLNSTEAKKKKKFILFYFYRFIIATTSTPGLFSQWITPSVPFLSGFLFRFSFNFLIGYCLMFHYESKMMNLFDVRRLIIIFCDSLHHLHHYRYQHQNWMNIIIVWMSHFNHSLTSSNFILRRYFSPIIREIFSFVWLLKLIRYFDCELIPSYLEWLSKSINTPILS